MKIDVAEEINITIDGLSLKYSDMDKEIKISGLHGNAFLYGITHQKVEDLTKIFNELIARYPVLRGETGK